MTTLFVSNLVKLFSLVRQLKSRRSTLIKKALQDTRLMSAGLEYDIACFDSCLPSSYQRKVMPDGVELRREAKANLVSLKFALHDDKKLHSWSMQLTRLTDVFFTVVYDSSNAVSTYLTPSCKTIPKLKIRTTPPCENKSNSTIKSTSIANLCDASDIQISIDSYGGKEKGKGKNLQGNGGEDMWGIKKKGSLWYYSIAGENLKERPFENGNEPAEIEVNTEQFSPGDITDFDRYVDLKSSEREEKVDSDKSSRKRDYTRHINE